jgi:hypothetical protein
MYIKRAYEKDTFAQLKEVWHEIFDFKFSRAPEFPNEDILKCLQKFTEICAIVPLYVLYTGDQLFTGVDDTGDCAFSRIFIDSIMTPVDDLSPVSMKPVITNRRYQRHRR